MKRQELKALLHGVENAGEIIDQIMEINGADIENAKKSVNTSGLTAQISEKDAKIAELEATLKAYEKGGDKYIDSADYERLKKFETDTVSAQKKEQQKAAVKKLLKDEHAREDMLDLLINGVNIDGVEIQKDGTIKDGANLVKTLKEKYAAGFSPSAPTGGAPFNPAGGKPAGDGADGFNFSFTPVNGTPKKKE